MRAPVVPFPLCLALVPLTMGDFMLVTCRQFCHVMVCHPIPMSQIQISGHPYVVSVSWDGGDVVIGAYDPATAVTLNAHVSPSRQATLGLPASLLRPANPDSPPSPADWEALFHRLSVRRDTAPHTLVLA